MTNCKLDVFNPFRVLGFSQVSKVSFFGSPPKKKSFDDGRDRSWKRVEPKLVSIEVADPDHASWSDVPSEVEGKNIAKTDGLGFSGSPQLGGSSHDL